MDTEVRLGKDSIGKDSLGKVSLVKDSLGNCMEGVVDTPPNTPPKKAKADKPVKHKYGEYQNVLLTDKELDKLKIDFGTDEVDKAITFLDAYIEEKGYKSKSHNLAMRRWVFDAIKEKAGKQKPDKATQLINNMRDW